MPDVMGEIPSKPKVYRKLLHTISDKDAGMATVSMGSILISDSISSRNNDKDS